MVEALGVIGVPAVPALIQALQDQEWWVREAAAEALGVIGDPQAVPALLEVLQDKEGRVRRAAAWALRKINAKDTWAIPEAWEIPEDVIRTLQALSEEEHRIVIWTLEIGDPQAVPILIEALKHGNQIAVRLTTIETLREIGAPAVLALVQALKDKNRDKDVRWTAASLLWWIGDPQATPALIQALQDKEWEVRQAAAQALGQIGDPQAIPALLEALKDADSGVRRAAAEALLKLLPISLPQNEQERRAWQKRLTSIRRAARRAKEYELLAAVLERQAAWEAALSPWQDPLQPPPVPAWRAWARRAGGGALALLIAGLVALVMAVLSGIGERLSETVRAFVQRQPLWAAALLIIILGAAVALLDWIREALRKKT